jgi:hypothetical protein
VANEGQYDTEARQEPSGQRKSPPPQAPVIWQVSEELEQEPSLHSTGKSSVHWRPVGHDALDETHEPSGQVTAEQASFLPQREPTAAQPPSLHLMGVAGGQVFLFGHSPWLRAQDPSGQVVLLALQVRTTDEHVANEVAQEPSSQSTLPAGQVVEEGQSLVSLTHVPSGQRVVRTSDPLHSSISRQSLGEA